MEIDVRLTDADIDALATRLAAVLAQHAVATTERGWLDVTAAAAHLSLTEHAIRGLVKRRQIPFHRMENSRVRFSVTELDHWVLNRSCTQATVDLS